MLPVLPGVLGVIRQHRVDVTGKDGGDGPFEKLTQAPHQVARCPPAGVDVCGRTGGGTKVTGEQGKAFNRPTDSGNEILTRSLQVPADVFLRVILKGLLVRACTNTQSVPQKKQTPLSPW